MSDLQLALLALGATIIASVILFNWWQERRISRETVRRFEGPADDALLNDFRIDPEAIVAVEEETIYIEERFDVSEEEPAPPAELNPEPSPDELEQATAPKETVIPPRHELAETEPYADSDALPSEDELLEEEAGFSVPIEQPAAEAATAQTVVDRLPASIDEQIDLVGLVHLNSFRSGTTLRNELQPLPKFDKPVQWFGLNDAGEWHYLTKDQEDSSFGCMACALQLADRSGPVSGETLRNFQLKIEDLAANLGARVEWQGNPDPQRYAAELDQFCIDVDVMVGFHIVQSSSGPFAGTKLRGLAESGGMKLRDDGNFHYGADSGETLFMLVNQDQRPFTTEALRTAFIRGLSFQLDVPRVRNCTEAFNQMVLLARQMEGSLGGRLVDDNQRALGDSEIEKIRQQLKIIYSRMVARGVIPGSPTALRLFS